MTAHFYRSGFRDLGIPQGCVLAFAKLLSTVAIPEEADLVLTVDFAYRQARFTQARLDSRGIAKAVMGAFLSETTLYSRPLFLSQTPRGLG